MALSCMKCCTDFPDCFDCPDMRDAQLAHMMDKSSTVNPLALRNHAMFERLSPDEKANILSVLSLAGFPKLFSPDKFAKLTVEVVYAAATGYLTRLLQPISPAIPPAKRLVGIETNPGPNGKRKQANLPQPPAKRPRRKNPRNPPRPRAVDAKARYRAGLTAPFLGGGMRLGLGSMVPSELKHGTYRNVVVPTVNATCFAYILGPTVGATAYASGAAPTYAPHIFASDSDLPGTTLGASNLKVVQGVSQAATISGSAQSGRVSGAGMRLKVSLAQTDNMSGAIFGGTVYETYTNLMTRTYTGLVNLATFTQIRPKAPGLYEIEAQYRPVDSTQLDFNGATVSTAGLGADVLHPYTIVVGLGFPVAKHSTYVDTEIHLETLSGVDPDDGDDSTVTDLSPGLSAEDVAEVVRDLTRSNPANVFGEFITEATHALTFARNRARGFGARRIGA